MNRLLKVLFIVTIVAMLGAAIMQIFIPEFNAERTGFGLSAGWQREIGLWNIAMIVILAGTLWKGSKNTVIIVSSGAFVLGFLLGTNHLIEFIKTSKTINMVGFIENYLLISLLALAIILEVKKKKEK